MRISRGSDATLRTDDDPNFTGRADRLALGPADAIAGAPSGFVVTFHDGARTNWHRHAGGQLLYVLDGAGLVATRGQDPQEIGPGDFVAAAPGEEHWHGAAPGGTLAHLAIAFGSTDWGEAST